MGAVPKRKVSRHRRGNRRRHQYLVAPELVRCPNCGGGGHDFCPSSAKKTFSL